MPKLKRSFKLIYKLIVVGILCLLSNTGDITAAESQIKITGSKVKAGQLIASFEAHNFLAGESIELLNKGFTLKLNYTIELWKSRGFWLDEPVARQKIEHVITYDIVRREYSAFRKIDEEISEETIFKMQQIIDWATKFMDVEISQIAKLQKKPFYYYSINAELNMLTVADLKDLLRLWRIGQESKRKFSLSNFFLRILIKRLVSQNVVRLKTESEKFQITEDYIKF